MFQKLGIRLKHLCNAAHALLRRELLHLTLSSESQAFFVLILDDRAGQKSPLHSAEAPGDQHGLEAFLPLGAGHANWSLLELRARLSRLNLLELSQIGRRRLVGIFRQFSGLPTLRQKAAPPFLDYGGNRVGDDPSSDANNDTEHHLLKVGQAGARFIDRLVSVSVDLDLSA